MYLQALELRLYLHALLLELLLGHLREGLMLVIALHVLLWLSVGIAIFSPLCVLAHLSLMPPERPFANIFGERQEAPSQKFGSSRNGSCQRQTKHATIRKVHITSRLCI